MAIHQNEKSKSANGQIQKLAIHFEFGHSLILAIRWSGPYIKDARWTAIMDSTEGGIHEPNMGDV